MTVICAIHGCGKDIRSPACPHPWHKPFDQWPGYLKEALKAQIPQLPSAGS